MGAGSEDFPKFRRQGKLVKSTALLQRGPILTPPALKPPVPAA